MRWRSYRQTVQSSEQIKVNICRSSEYDERDGEAHGINYMHEIHVLIKVFIYYVL